MAKGDRSRASDARAAASRKNGRKGGRGRSKLSQDLLDEIGPPPDDNALALAAWMQRFCAKAIWAIANGEISPTIAERLRGWLATSPRLMPANIAYEVDKILREEARERDEDPGPVEEEAPRDRPQAIRRDPR